MKAQESIQQFCVQEKMTDVDGKHFKMGVEDWDITLALAYQVSTNRRYDNVIDMITSINTVALPFLVDKSISLSTSSPIRCGIQPS